MSIKTSRTEGKAEVFIDHARCTKCGLCAEICNGNPLYMKDGEIHIDQDRLFGCIACGHCMAICPQSCITVSGREMSPHDIIALPTCEKKANYQQLWSLFAARRSVRQYSDKEVEQDKIQQIITAATTAPMGIPPSDVRVLVLQGKAKVRQFSFDFIDFVAKQKWLFSPLVRTLLRPFIGKEFAELLKTFVAPAADFFITAKKRGENYLLYDAPLAMLFYDSPYCDPADPYIAATYAMLAAESLGLGTCMIGSVAPFIKSNKSFKAKYGISPDMKGGLIVICGYSTVKFQHGLNRSFAEVNFY